MNYGKYYLSEMKTLLYCKYIMFHFSDKYNPQIIVILGAERQSFPESYIKREVEIITAWYPHHFLCNVACERVKMVTHNFNMSIKVSLLMQNKQYKLI